MRKMGMVQNFLRGVTVNTEQVNIPKALRLPGAYEELSWLTVHLTFAITL